MNRRVPGRFVAVFAVAFLALATMAMSQVGGSDAAPDPSDDGWSSIASTARGQTVRLWMWGGEDALNRHIDDDVVPVAAAAGVRLVRVPVDDTATALARIAAERDAGRSSGGAVDLLWINGKNFAQGKDAGLWLPRWAERLPNATKLDPDDATLRNDFGVPTDGQEMPWSRAAFVLAHDPTRVSRPPTDFEALARYVAAHPGRVTYPAPPDFTGSAFVRQAVQALGEDRAFALLAEMRPNLWGRGERFPKDQAELDRLFASGQVDLAMSYNPSFVQSAVRRGEFAPTVRPYVFSTGTLQNVSFLAIPANASSPEGAQVVADLMLSPALQAAKLERVGIPTVLDLRRVGDARAAFDIGASPHRLETFGPPLEELPASRVPELDRRWRDEVLR
jgi:putative spermidine/putrescine transport system substrate-binding protein